MKCQSILSLFLILVSIQFAYNQVPLYNEPFDTEIPAGWQTFDLDGNNVHTFFASQGMFVNAWEFQTFSGQFGPAAYSIALYQPAGQADDWLISPPVMIGDDSRLRFEMIQEVIYDSIEVLMTPGIIGVIPSPPDFTTTLFKGSVQPYLWSDIEIDLSAFPAGHLYLAFRNISNNGQLMGIRNVEVVNIIPRDVAVLGIPVPEPTGCTYGSSEQIGMEIEIVGSQSIGEFTFNYSINGGPAVSEQILLFVPLPPGTKFTYPFTNLADLSSGYEQHIKVWSDVFLDTNYVNDTAEIILYSFTSHDLNESAYACGFENTLSDSSRFAWTFTDGDSDQVVPLISDSAAFTGSQSLLIQGWGDWAFSPCLELESSKNYQLDFWAREIIPAALPNIMTVWLGTSNDPSSMNTQILPPTWVIDTFGTGVWTRYTLPIQPQSTGSFHIGIQHQLGLGIFIDDFAVSIDSVNTCFAPTGLTTTVINSKTVTLSWDPQPSAISYVVAGRKAGDALYVRIPAAGNSITATGLASATTYAWKVASVCASDTVFSFETQFNIADTLFCGSPVSMLAIQVTQTSALLTWSHVGNAQKYQILGRKVGAFPIVSIIVPGADNFFQANGLSPGTIYEWTVRSICDTINGVVSGINQVTTFVTLPLLAEKSVSGLAPDIRISPNPGDGRFEISGLSLDEEVRVEVFDQMGREVDFDHANFNLDISGLAAGVYFINLSAEDWSVVERVVVY